MSFKQAGYHPKLSKTITHEATLKLGLLTASPPPNPKKKTHEKSAKTARAQLPNLGDAIGCASHLKKSHTQLFGALMVIRVHHQLSPILALLQGIFKP